MFKHFHDSMAAFSSLMAAIYKKNGLDDSVEGLTDQQLVELRALVSNLDDAVLALHKSTRTVCTTLSREVRRRGIR